MSRAMFLWLKQLLVEQNEMGISQLLITVIHSSGIMWLENVRPLQI